MQIFHTGKVRRFSLILILICLPTSTGGFMQRIKQVKTNAHSKWDSALIKKQNGFYFMYSYDLPNKNKIQ